MEKAILSQLGQVSVAARSVRTAFTKVRKTVGEAQAETAQLRSQLRRKDMEIEALQPRKKTRVRVSGNERFVSQAEIRGAKEESLRVPRSQQAAEPAIQPEIVVAT